MKTSFSKASLTSALVSLAMAFARLNAHAAVPTTMGYQGQIKVTGVPFNGNGQFKFAIIDRPTGASLWSNDGTSVKGAAPTSAVTLPVKDGLFTVLLGDSTLANMEPLDPTLFVSHGDTALRSWFNDGAKGWTQLTDRPLASVPYALAAPAPNGSITGAQLAPGSIAPTHLSALNTPQAGRVLSYDIGGKFNWTDLSVVNNTWARNGNVAYYNSGNVGIGTAAPSHRLSIAGGPLWTGHSWLGAVALENAAAIGWAANAKGHRFGMGHSADGFYMFRTASDPGDPWSPAVYDFTISDSGNVGIGVLDPARRLTVYSPSYGIEHTDGTVRLGTFINSAGGWLGTVSDHKLNFFVNNGMESMTIDTKGHVGIGTINPGAPLEVEGGNWNETVTPNIRLTGTKPTLEWHRGNFLDEKKWIAHFGDTSGLEFWYRSINREGFPTQDSGWRKKATIGLDGSLELAGNASVKSLTIRGGADFAEPFELSGDHVPEGSVMVIDPLQPGKLKLSDGAYDKKVAGIVSGANGVKSGIVLSQEGVLDKGQQVALSGRVYVLADAQNGPIEPGDLLTTSDRPGRAMKATDLTRAQGAVLGKAMTGLTNENGMVLVLVTLQ